MASKIEIYTRDFCGFCSHAKKMLSQRNLAFEEYNIWRDSSKKDEMLARSNGSTTVPQIFVDGTHIGGCDDLIESIQSGEFQKLTDQA
ncbi:MAG: glutaredoxin 3 [Alphaproteobacteria bacterium]